jgi:hypothetical protein
MIWLLLLRFRRDQGLPASINCFLKTLTSKELGKSVYYNSYLTINNPDREDQCYV